MAEVIMKRCDKRTFERAYAAGERVSIVKDPTWARDNETFAGRGFTKSEVALDDVYADGPSRAGERWFYWVAVAEPTPEVAAESTMLEAIRESMAEAGVLAEYDESVAEVARLSSAIEAMRAERGEFDDAARERHREELRDLFRRRRTRMRRVASLRSWHAGVVAARAERAGVTEVAAGAVPVEVAADDDDEVEVEVEPDVFEAIDGMARVWKNTEFAEDLYRAMAWVEVASLASVLHAGSCSDAGATIVRAWVAANTAEDVAEATAPVTPAALLAMLEAGAR